MLLKSNQQFENADLEINFEKWKDFENYVFEQK